MPLGETGESGAVAGYLGFTPFLEEVCISGGELGHVPLSPLTVVGEWQAVPITAKLSCGWSWRAGLGQCASGECDCTASPWVCVKPAKLIYVHTHLSQWWCRNTARTCVKRWLVSGSGHLCPPAPLMCAHKVQCVACGGGEDELQPVPLALSPYYISTRPVPAAGLGVSRVWGPAGGQERFSEAPTGFLSPGPREKRSPARKPLRRCPHYITDIPATRPATLRRGAGGNAKQDGAPSGRAGPQGRQSGSVSPQRPAGTFQTPAPGSTRWAPGGGQRRGRGRVRGLGAGGGGVKCGISCRAVVPDPLPSVRGSV